MAESAPKARYRVRESRWCLSCNDAFLYLAGMGSKNVCAKHSCFTKATKHQKACSSVRARMGIPRSQ